MCPEWSPTPPLRMYIQVSSGLQEEKSRSSLPTHHSALVKSRSRADGQTERRELSEAFLSAVGRCSRDGGGGDGRQDRKKLMTSSTEKTTQYICNPTHATYVLAPGMPCIFFFVTCLPHLTVYQYYTLPGKLDCSTNQEGANTERYALRQALGEMFPTPSLFGTGGTIPTVDTYRAWKSRPSGVLIYFSTPPCTVA